jgi:branched-chain amino acid aminotransferase
VATPPVTASILEGITRASLISLLQEQLGITCAEREADRTELYDCEEAFLCSTGLEIVPIGSVDGIAVNGARQSPLTARLTDLYGRTVRGTLSAHPEWRTPVYQATR